MPLHFIFCFSHLFFSKVSYITLLKLLIVTMYLFTSCLFLWNKPLSLVVAWRECWVSWLLNLDVNTLHFLRKTHVVLCGLSSLYFKSRGSRRLPVPPHFRPVCLFHCWNYFFSPLGKGSIKSLMVFSHWDILGQPIKPESFLGFFKQKYWYKYWFMYKVRDTSMQ